ncbi:MAG: RNA-binding protein [Victivallales bacterium]|nr:RNA-binding protein [Victivallales bacterium]
MKLYVGNLSFSTQEQDLSDAFSAFGTVDSVNIINDRETGRSKGFGFVEMNDNQEAKTAIAELDGKDLGGRNLKVSEAKPREDRPARGGFGGGGGGGGRNRW